MRYGDLTERVGKEESAVFMEDTSGVGTLEPANDLSNTREALLRVIKLSFVPTQKWRFTDGAATFNAAITDPVFLDRLASRQEGFYSGDVLRVLLSSAQGITASGRISAEYTVEKVLDHLSTPQQGALFPKTPEAPPGPKLLS